MCKITFTEKEHILVSTYDCAITHQQIYIDFLYCNVRFLILRNILIEILSTEAADRLAF